MCSSLEFFTKKGTFMHTPHFQNKVHIRNHTARPCISIVQLAALVFLTTVLSFGQQVKSQERSDGSKTILTLSNDQIEYSIVIDSGKILSDKLIGQSGWTKQYGTHPSPIETDGDFGMEVMWTEWQAPNFVNNAENPARLNKSNFRIQGHEFKQLDGGKKELILSLKGDDFPMLAQVVYEVEPASFYVRRKLIVADTSRGGHFLQKIFPCDLVVTGVPTIIKDGGFGQPVAFQTGEGGGFFGLEYPAADNTVQTLSHEMRMTCGQEIGEKIGRTGIESEWAVEGITPNAYVKWWFMKYVDDIRVAPLRPYTLYNSWYDLRSPEYPRVQEGNWMNEKNIFHIIDLIRKNMIEKHEIKLDAFVLDDGWDVYESDWVLRQKEFPRGLKPISDELKKTNTSLGMWFGPIGGYSFRSKRAGWMKQHGYEMVGDQMCVAGKNYSALLKKRVTDFTADEGVGYFKWDGIQFSCSEPDHGHPVGIYSRRAVMEKVIDMCRSVRSKNPNMFLNITSGTWLSPWWVKYANTIWMQGADYGYADVPSISPRDAAITYRDFVLYDDFKNRQMWFPIANLMTHGIIKGNLEWLGGKEEPLDKFTNEVLLYFARGVTMWELYISPDILTDGEWNALGQAMHWAKDRFPILSTTEMVGGDPTKRETYGYVHMKGKKGVIAARNPWIEPNSLSVKLDPAFGIDPEASSLVVEKVYPSRWISPRLYSAGSSVNLPLDGYEMAIYEVYPLSEADVPLIAGARFGVDKGDAQSQSLTVYETTGDIRVLNPELMKSLLLDGKETQLAEVVSGTPRQPAPLEKQSFTASSKTEMNLEFTLGESVSSASLEALLTPSAGGTVRKLPLVLLAVDGKVDTVKNGPTEGASAWYALRVPAGRHAAQIRVISRESSGTWHVAVWMVCRQKQQGVPVTVVSSQKSAQRPMPPMPLAPGEVVRNIKIGEADIESSGEK